MNSDLKTIQESKTGALRAAELIFERQRDRYLKKDAEFRAASNAAADAAQKVSILRTADAHATKLLAQARDAMMKVEKAAAQRAAAEQALAALPALRAAVDRKSEAERALGKALAHQKVAEDAKTTATAERAAELREYNEALAALRMPRARRLQPTRLSRPPRSLQSPHPRIGSGRARRGLRRP